MILISHRGNINGKTKKENHPDYIKKALNYYDVEVDLWYKNKKFLLGHDFPQYEIEIDFLLENKSQLWVHCKDYNTFQNLSIKYYRNMLNFFYHTKEDYVLTSHGYIWAFPGKKGGQNTICVLPENNNTNYKNFCGICSDFIGNYIG